jgi:hypothetical protein
MNLNVKSKYNVRADPCRDGFFLQTGESRLPFRTRPGECEQSMVRFARLLVWTLVVLAPVALTVVVSGCGGSSENSDIVISEAAKKADAGGQKAMEEFYRTKMQKGKSKKN